MLKLLCAMACIIVIAGGCVSTPPGTPQTDISTQEAPVPDTKTLAGYKCAGFLSDYSKLRPDAGGKAMVYIKPGFDFKGYDKVMVDRLKFFYKDDAEYKGIDPTDLKALADYFHESFSKDLGNAYPVVNEPGPGVLYIRVAITEIIPNKPSVSVVTLVVPYLTVADLASGTASKGGAGSNFYVGSTVIEAEFIDSQTNEQLVAYVEKYIPKKYNVDLNKGVIGATKHGFKQYFKAYSTWDYTKEAFDFWLLKLRQKLDEAHGKTSPD
ncbi:MAG: DUF3313 domain-containing protein [Deltaproteobacteria bacterium]